MADRNGYIGRAPGDSSVVVSRQIFSPTGVTTDFTFASGYTVGYLDLYLNGSRLIEGPDYAATDGETISLISAAANGDVLEGVAYKAFNLTNDKVGIQSGGVSIGNAQTLNFVGTGNTFAINGSTIDVSISGGSAGAGGTWGNYDSNTGVTTTKKVKIQNNLEVTGVTTSTGGFVGGSITGTTGSFSGNVSVGGTLTYEDVTNIDSVGLVTARSGLRVVGGGVTAVGVATFYNGIDLNTSNSKINTGSGINVVFQDQGTDKIHFEVSTQSIRPQTANTGEVGNATYPFNKVTAQILDATGGVNVTGIVTASAGVQVGSGQSFGANGPTAVYYGDGSNLTNLPAAGLTTEALVSSGIVTTLNLTAAQDHKVTASGITTITVSGGTESDSHTVRIINSGITTVGFSTYFLFPSGSAPVLPTASGAISLISFTVNRVGAGGTQLLAGASVNYS